MDKAYYITNYYRDLGDAALSEHEIDSYFCTRAPCSGPRCLIRAEGETPVTNTPDPTPTLRDTDGDMDTDEPGDDGLLPYQSPNRLDRP